MIYAFFAGTGIAPSRVLRQVWVWDGGSRWHADPLLVGKGKCNGCSAMAAELLAHRCLCESISMLLLGQEVFDPQSFTPWKFPEKLNEFVQPEFSQQFVPIKQEWRDSVEVEGETTESSGDDDSQDESEAVEEGEDNVEENREIETFWENLFASDPEEPAPEEPDPEPVAEPVQSEPTLPEPTTPPMPPPEFIHCTPPGPPPAWQPIEPIDPLDL